MKKQSHLNDNERGFFLPYVMVLSTIILIFVTNAIYIYENELEISSNVIDQITYETQYKMAINKLLRERPFEHTKEGMEAYYLPNGKTDVFYTKEHGRLQVKVQVYGEDDYMYPFHRTIHLKEDIMTE
ncbi:hypothetical protein [Pseudogracilibacillus sp. ICA-222130]|uniref:hypothetical protein n=1 Tax=Pseudogracilibacillus sp. ICA-222130 TaxID=3134655 RepID=UPI0030C3059C